jgi:hypothetical protein
MPGQREGWRHAMALHRREPEKGFLTAKMSVSECYA